MKTIFVINKKIKTKPVMIKNGDKIGVRRISYVKQLNQLNQNLKSFIKLPKIK